MKYIYILVFGIMFLSLASAYDSQIKGVDLQYSFSSNNATQCSVSTGNTPYGLLTLNQIATKTGQTFNITIKGGNFTLNGDYCFNLVCTDGVYYQTGSVCKTISQQGTNQGINPQVIIIAMIGFGIFTWIVTYKFNKFLGNLSFVLLGLGIFFYFIQQGVDVFGWIGLFVSIIMTIKMIIDLIKF